ncbi:MAG: glycosyltransferase [Oscillospiraceae bacterium]|nr:glycosyltransferase [Oscillospiraceae bacterium]
MEHTLISIVVPVYKAEKYLENCVLSVLNQTHKNLEVILVNDGSPDKSGDICNSLAVKDKRIKVINKQNSGAAAARNTGIRVAQGDYIAFVDSDDTIDCDMYEHMLKCINRTGADICICGFQKCHETYNESIKVPHENLMNTEELWTAFLKDFISYRSLITSPWNKLIRTNLLRMFNNGDEPMEYFPEELRNAEDMWFVIDCISFSDNGIIFADFTPYNYNVMNNPLSLNKENTKAFVDNKNNSLSHLGEVMINSLPDKKPDINDFIKQQQAYNVVVSIKRAVINKEKPCFKMTREIMISTLQISPGLMEKLSIAVLYFFPDPVFRFIRNLINGFKKRKDRS